MENHRGCNEPTGQTNSEEYQQAVSIKRRIIALSGRK